MRATRRALLAGGGLLLAAPAALVALNAELAVYDSRSGASLAFAAEADAAGARLFDIAHEDERLWRGVREGLPLIGPLIGLTRWSDWTILRGVLEARGRRVRREVRLDIRPDAPRILSALTALDHDGAGRAATLRGASVATLFAWRVT